MKKICCLLLIIFPFLTQAQTVVFTGKITDSLNNPLTSANIIADPIDEGSIAFAFSNTQGDYKLSLIKNKSYRLTVSYLGYRPDTLRVEANQEKTINFQLKEENSSLDEVIINYRQPIVIKEDTISYRPEAFTTGNERKLRDILDKLPMIEVDKEGNVKVQGRKVTKLLVENKEFFTGDSKLAVNNIPANVVDEIEVLDNYNRVSFLKDLEDSEHLAMNIKLKEDKKKFVFGDLEVGGGIEDKFLIHPTLYYYSPKTTFNFIGDFNNIGVKSFSLQDYLEFEGGTQKLIKDAKGYFSLLYDDFAQFLMQTDFIESTNKFAALSYSQELNSKISITSYGIISGMDNSTAHEITNNYPAMDNLEEQRLNTSRQKPSFGIGKLNLEISPNQLVDITADSYFKFSDYTYLNELTSAYQDQINIFNTQQNGKDLLFQQNINWNQQFNKKNTSSGIINYSFKETTPQTTWLTDQAFLTDFLPWMDDAVYQLHQTKEIAAHDLNAIFKHYLILNRYNHIYFSAGLNMNFSDYKTAEEQILEDGTINDFSSANFGNDTRFDLKDFHVGLQYKAQIGKMILKPGIALHQYFWDITQSNISTSKQKLLLLPELDGELKLNSTKRLKFDYKLKTKFANIQNYADHFIIRNFNNLYKGNNDLDNELYHQASLHFSNFNVYNNIFWHVALNYYLKDKNLEEIVIQEEEGINYYSSPVLADLKNESINFGGSIEKTYKLFKVSFQTHLTFGENEKIYNDQTIKNKRTGSSFGIRAQTKLTNLPNIDLHLNKSYDSYNFISTYKFETDLLSVGLDYDISKDLVFKFNYDLEGYKNKNSNHRDLFNIAHSSFTYHQSESAWSFEIEGKNIFDVGFKRRNTFSSILVSDQKTFIMPRMVILKITYKL